MGHFLDHQLIGHPGDYASRSGAAILSDWKAAIEGTKAHRRLSDLAEMNKARIGKPGGGFTYVAVDRPYARYLLQPQELFARSYAQFVAIESQNPEFVSELALLRATREGAIKYPSQWENEDFQAIRDSLLKAMMDLKWLK